MATSELARPGLPNFVDLLRSFPGQARLALGTRGVLWATFAGIVGVVCCIVAFADIALSLHRSDVDPQRRVDVDRANRGRAVAFPRDDGDRGFVRRDRS